MSFHIPKKKFLMSGAIKLRPQEVFSSLSYNGNGTTNKITNGLNLSGKGGLVIAKDRPNNSQYGWIDTVRGRSKIISSDGTGKEVVSSAGVDLASFDADGFTLGGPSQVFMNRSATGNMSWSFLRSRKFFDVFTYTGDGTQGRKLPHILGVTPGMVIIKRTDDGAPWAIWHRSIPSTHLLTFDANSQIQYGSTSVFGSHSASDITVNANPSFGNTNTNSNLCQYVAYVFAQNPDLIDCGRYTASAAPNPFITFGSGWQPQTVLIKGFANGTPWSIVDLIRSPDFSGDEKILYFDRTNLESSGDYFNPLSGTAPTGVRVATQSSDVNQNGYDYIYMAIRKPT